jgi:hypothetical protein
MNKEVVTLEDIFLSKEEIVFGATPLFPGSIEEI